MGGHGHFKGKTLSSNKNQYNFSCRKFGLKHLSSKNFFKKKKNILSKITPKNNFFLGGEGDTAIFEAK